MPDLENGGRPAHDRASMLTVSALGLRALSMTRRRDPVATPAEAAPPGGDEEQLYEAFARARVEQPGTLVPQMTRDRQGATGATIVTDTGQVLDDDAGFGAAVHGAGVHRDSTASNGHDHRPHDPRTSA